METPDKRELLKVAYDNQRENQIGGQTDGIDPETARDLGYTMPDEVVDLVDRVEERQNAEQVEADQLAVEAAKKVVEGTPAAVKKPVAAHSSVQKVTGVVETVPRSESTILRTLRYPDVTADRNGY